MAEFHVALTTPSPQVVTVKYAVTGGTATGGGSDFTLANGTVNFNANEMVKTVRFPIVNDTRDEADETTQIKLSVPSNTTLAAFANTVFNVTILDDDAPPSVSFSTAASTGSESATAPKLTVALSSASGQTVTVPYIVSGGTATSGADFTLASGTVTFSPGQTTRTIALAIINDLRQEDAETIAVTLGTPTNASLGTNATHTYTIQDNDPISTFPEVNFVSATASTTEPAATASFNLPTVQLTSALTKTATVKYSITGGSAKSGSDFVLASGTLTFTPAGSLTQMIPISLLPDTLNEADETIQISLSSPSSLLLGTVTATTLTLLDDDDSVPQVNFSVATSTARESVTTANLNVTLSASSGQTVTVPYSLTGGTATGGGVDVTLPSGTLTFSPGQTSKTIPLVIVNDKLHELNETVQVTLGEPALAALGTVSAHTYTIQDDDLVPKVAFKAGSSSASERLGLDILPVVLSAASSQTVTVNYAVTGGTASGADFVLPSGTLMFAPGETTKNISLEFVDDGLVESNETVRVSLSLPANANAILGTNALHTATIVDGGILPSVKFLAATSSGSESIRLPTVAVVLSAATSKTVTVNYSVTGGTTTGADFVLPNGTLTFLPGETTKNIPLAIVDDRLIDPRETIQVTLAVPNNATLGTTKQHTFTIQDNDPLVGFDTQPPTITVTSPTDGLQTDSNVMVQGQVTDDFTGVKTFQARVDGGTFSNVSVDANGFWGFTTSLPLDGSADGSHTVQFRASDRLDNLSDFVPFHFTLSTEPPELTAQLAIDTGISASDGVTFDPTITGSARHLSVGAEFRAGFDSTPVENFVDVLGDRQSDGSFTFSAARLAAINSGTIADGIHTLHLRATDSRGDVATANVVFTLDTSAGATSAGLSIGSDTGTVGDGQTSVANVTVVGTAEPGVNVRLGATGPTTTASTAGVFQFSNVALVSGSNEFAVHVMDRVGNATELNLSLTRVAGAVAGDMVLTWNQNALLAIRADGSDPLIASRTLAMVSVAVYDAVNAVEGVPGLYVSVPAPTGASIEAAVAAATARVLSAAYPTQAGTFATKLANSLSTIPAGQSRDDGVAVGQAVANAIVVLRANDGYQGFAEYIPGTGPGMWQLTAPMFMPAVAAHWSDVTPFVIDVPNDFLPAGPPALSSAQWAAEFNQVKDIGANDSATRTADQTQIARFWSDGQGTYTPPGHWNEIAQQVSSAVGNSLSANARMFAMLNTAMMDAGIVTWDAKYTYEFWRPITAIHEADTDGNAATVPDLDWQPLLGTPSFPEYTSGHSTFSGAAAGVLEILFGENVSFATTSIGLPNVTRNYTSFDHAAEEAGLSRIYGGIHFLAADLDGLAAGHAVASAVLAAFVGEDTQPPRILVDDYSAAADQNIVLTGHVLDTVSGVARLTATVDDTMPVDVNFDPSTGEFSFPLSLATDGSADGVHQVVLVARDAAGNSTEPLDLFFTLDTAVPTLSLTSPANGEIVAGLRLTGSANATGSTIAALSYAFDGGMTMPIGFNPANGEFDEPLDVGNLTVGSHTLSVTAMDAAGNTAVTDLNLTLGAALPLTLTGKLPHPDASEIGVTFHPKFNFSRPVDPATLTNTNIRASFSGQNLPITIVPGSDGTFAWIFFASPMPGGATIEITVDGSAIRAPDGTQLDADDDGTPGGTLRTSFRTVSTTGVMGTTISGTVLDPGPDQIPHDFDDVRAGPDGIINTDDDVNLFPLAGVKVFVLGMESQADFTDAQGRFELESVPSGNVKLVFQGRTATNAPAGFYFPEMVMDLDVIAGIENFSMPTMPGVDEFYLPRVSTNVLHTVSGPNPMTIGLEPIASFNLTPEQAAAVSLTVQPGTAIGENGQPMASAEIGISVVPADYVRMMLPNGVNDLPFSFTVQALGVAEFTTPLSLTLPNLTDVAPGTKSLLISYDHATGLMAIEGTMTVSADGETIRTDPSVGITHPGWYFVAPAPPPRREPKNNPLPSQPDAHASARSIPPTQRGNNEFVLMYFPDVLPNPLAVRLRSDDGGHFEALVPGGEEYQFILFDPGSGLVATRNGTTPANASRFDPTTGLSLRASTAPDTDGDGLPDDAEFAIGSDQGKIDTDGDGVSDFAEVKQGLDPLSNIPLAVGLTAGLSLNGSAKEIVVTGSAQSPTTLTGFVATGSHGLAIVDLSEFRRPIAISEMDLPGDATDVDADLTAKIAVVASNAGGLHFVNIANPLRPTLIRTLNVNASSVEISDGVVYAAVGTQLRSFDELTGDALQSVTPGGGTITGLAREGTTLYTMDSGRVLRAIDTVGFTMTARGTLTLPHGGAKIFVDNGIAYAAVGASLPQGGFVTVNVSNSNSLTLISDADNGDFGLGGNVVVTNGSGLALLAGQALTIPRSNEIVLLNVADPSNTFAFLNRVVLPETPLALTIASGIVFVADGTAGLQVVNYRAFDALGQPPTVTISSTVADVDAGTPGTQVVEGSSIPVRVVAVDDVQIRSVELLVNGVVQATDVQGPFDFFAIAPAISASGTQATVQVRATDTGGNSSLANVLNFSLRPDIVPPVVSASSPANNGTVFDTNAMSVRFNESLNTSLLSLAGVTLTNFGNDGTLSGGDDSIVPLVSIAAAAPNRVIVLPAAPLPKGKFQLVLNKSILADVAGNAAAVDATLTFTNYINLSPTTVVWASDSNGAWENPANWSTGVVPGVNDDVLIDRIGANPTVTHDTGNHTVRSLQTTESLTISGGTMTINGGSTSLLQGPLTITSGASLMASGASTIVNATGPTNLNGGNVFANTGGVLNLPAMTSYAGSSFNTFIQADNANSQVNLPNLTTLSGGTSFGAVFIRALTGGLIDLPSLSGISGGATQLLADASTINAPVLTSFVDTSVNATSEIRVRNNGTITLGTGSVIVANVDVIADTPSVLTVGTLTLAAGSRLFGTGTITGNLSNGGLVSIGSSSGSAISSLSVTGHYTRTSAGSLTTQIGGLTSGTQFDRLSVTGAATIDGTLNLSLANSFNPAVGNTFQILVSSAAVTGQFTTVTGTSIVSGKSFMVGINAANVTLTVTSPLAATGSTSERSIASANIEPLTHDQVQPLVDAAIERLVVVGLDESHVLLLRGIEFRIADLGFAADARFIGMAAGNVIWLDRDAAGYGWFVDPTPHADEEFGPGGEASWRMDLLTVLAHELSHLLGFEHDTESSHLMSETLTPGTRLLPIGIGADIDHAFANPDWP